MLLMLTTAAKATWQVPDNWITSCHLLIQIQLDQTAAEQQRSTSVSVTSSDECTAEQQGTSRY